MNVRRNSKTKPCGRQEATIRLAQAKKFLEVAELCIEDKSDDANPQVAAALAVLAGIAGCDAACCAIVKKRSRAQDHHDAEELVASIHPVGPAMAKDLRRLLDEKDNAHYGTMLVGSATAKRMIGWADRLLENAEVLISA